MDGRGLDLNRLCSFLVIGTLFQLLTTGSQPASLQNENDLYLLSYRDTAKDNQMSTWKVQSTVF